MRSVKRPSLSSASIATLAKLQSLVNAATTPAHQPDVLWSRKTNSKPRREAFDEVRKALDSMARGRKRCMYCEDNLGTDIDHFRPKAKHRGSTFVWSNFLLACSHCNSNEKRSLFPLDASGQPLLVDPSVDDPVMHLALVPETGWFAPHTTKGTETEKVFGLNRREELTQGRADAWAHLERLVEDVGRAPTTAVASQLVAQAKRLSFQSVVHYFVRDGLLTTPKFVKAQLSAVLKAKPTLWSWAL